MIGWFKSLFREEQKKDDVFIPPETRISAITLRNGEIFYIPEYCNKKSKRWFEIPFRLFNPSSINKIDRGTLEYSKALIDYFIQKQREDWGKKEVKVEYVKYP